VSDTVPLVRSEHSRCRSKQLRARLKTRGGRKKMFIYVNMWKIQELLTFSLYVTSQSLPKKKTSYLWSLRVRLNYARICDSWFVIRDS